MRRRGAGSACLVGAGCGGDVDAASPVALCELHLALAADWASRESGRTDLLPVACRACGSRVGIRYPSGWICAVCEWRVGEVVDGELPPPRVDVVYYLRQADRIKIGTSANPRQRFTAIWHEQVLAFERGDRTLEQRRHAQFADERFPGSEWFRMSRRLSAHVASVAAGVDDPWDRYARWVSEAVALRG
ncbi:MAG TPA: GIY-YIG nuclease family protein [Pseudolysinimonas sp.]|nr:GIY-YIG nuclease family protein [Pseudolysinimonas sp.]